MDSPDTPADLVASTLFKEKTEENIPTKEFLLVELDGELYAVGVADIEMVMKIPPVTAVPNAPSAIVGIFHLRGQVVVAIDLLKRMGLMRKNGVMPYFLFIVEQGKNHFGIMVDHTRTVVRIPEGGIIPLDPVTAAHIPERFTKGTFLYLDKVTTRSYRQQSDIMIAPAGTEKAMVEPIFTERPVVILDLPAILNEEELRTEGISGATNSPGPSQAQ
jgi:purine-binding chemotaxis protein CheW